MCSASGAALVEATSSFFFFFFKILQKEVQKTFSKYEKKGWKDVLVIFFSKNWRRKNFEFSDSEHGQSLGCQPRKFWKFQNSETVGRLTKGVPFYPPSKTFSFFSFVGDILDATLPSEQGWKCLRVYRSRISRLNRKSETVGRLRSHWSLYQ